MGDSDITARLQRTAEDLRSIQQLLTIEAIDHRVLLEFRQAVDHVRDTAWGVQQFVELRQTRKDPFTALDVLSQHRIRRAAQLCRDIAMDLDAGELAAETEGLAQLAAEARALLKRLEQLPLAPER